MNAVTIMVQIAKESGNPSGLPAFTETELLYMTTRLGRFIADIEPYGVVNYQMFLNDAATVGPV